MSSVRVAGGARFAAVVRAAESVQPEGAREFMVAIATRYSRVVAVLGETEDPRPPDGLTVVGQRLNHQLCVTVA